MINSLCLTNFRRYESLKIDTDSPIVIIHGRNAIGKSTILEAIYFLTNGESPWSSENVDLISNSAKDKGEMFMRIEAGVSPEEADDDEGDDSYAIFHDMRQKVYFINSKKTTKPKFFRRLASVIFSPEQIELLMVSAQKRRAWLDTLISKIDIEYYETLLKFNKILRQRNAYLKKLSKRFYQTGEINTDDQQLEYWSTLLAQFSSKLMVKRIAVLEELKGEGFKVVYTPCVDLTNFMELLETNQIAKLHMLALKDSYRRDVAVGHSTKGAHRDDWHIVTDKDVRRYGSRGEKRMAITHLIFQSEDLIAEKTGARPILLLDDIPSELDEENTKLIFSDEHINKQQTFITTIDLKSIPEEIVKKAKVIGLT